MRGDRGGAVAPAELGAVDPHAVQDHGEAPGDGDNGTPHAAPLGHPQAPCFQPRPFSGMDKQRLRSLVEHRTQHGVAGLGDAAIIVDFPRLMSPRGQSDMCADGPGMDEALRLIDGCPVGQRDDDTRSHVILPISLRY